jgi:hypothetical protein
MYLHQVTPEEQAIPKISTPKIKRRHLFCKHPTPWAFPDTISPTKSWISITET